jgi:hypothetical protein
LIRRAAKVKATLEAIAKDEGVAAGVEAPTAHEAAAESIGSGEELAHRGLARAPLLLGG